MLQSVTLRTTDLCAVLKGLLRDHLRVEVHRQGLSDCR